MPDESAPLAFLEKSHCVPILLALYRKGMMNRNQLYDELGQTINIVMKRIHLLIDINLIEERKMKVKPFAKFIFLTSKGWDIADSLEHMEQIMNRPIYRKSKRIHLGDNPFMNVLDQSFDDETEDTIQLTEIDWSNYNCPNCKAEMHLFKDEDRFTWICFDCGTRKPSSIDEAINASLSENLEELRHNRSKPKEHS